MAAHQASPSLGFSRQEHWSGLPFPSPMQESEKWKWSLSIVSDSLQPHGLQPTRLLRPWDFPVKSTGVGCHCLLRCISEVIDISSSNFDPSLSFLKPSVSHDLLCIEVKYTGWQYTALTDSFPNLESVRCYMSGSDCCFLTCIQYSQEVGNVG